MTYLELLSQIQYLSPLITSNHDKTHQNIPQLIPILLSEIDDSKLSIHESSSNPVDSSTMSFLMDFYSSIFHSKSHLCKFPFYLTLKNGEFFFIFEIPFNFFIHEHLI